jgi:hypothetical protein
VPIPPNAELNVYGNGSFSKRGYRQVGESCMAVHERSARADLSSACCWRESMLQRFGVTEANWRDADKKDPNFLESESPLYVGRAVAALAADPQVLDYTGQLVSSWNWRAATASRTTTAVALTGDISQSIGRCCLGRSSSCLGPAPHCSSPG